MPGFANLANSTIATIPASPSTATSGFVLATDTGAWFAGTLPMDVTVGPATGEMTPANSEIVRLQSMSGDTVTLMTRGMYGTTPRNIQVGDRFFNSITANAFASSPNQTSQAPSNLTLPTIQGSPIVGQTLSCLQGTWTNSPTEYTYQWQEIAAGGTAALVQQNANGYGNATSFTLDLPLNVTDGNAVAVMVATNTNNEVSSVSGLGGTWVLGSKVTTTTPEPLDLEWWYCIGATGGSLAITIETSTECSITAYAAEYAGVIGAVAGGTNSGTSLDPTVTSSPSGTGNIVLAAQRTGGNIISSPSGWVNYTGASGFGSIFGVATIIGATAPVVADWTTTSGDPNYWLAASLILTTNTTGTLSGATTDLYEVVSSNEGNDLMCTVTAFNSYTTTGVTATSQPTAEVVAASGSVIQNLTPPTISGTPAQNNVLTAVPGTWTNSPTGTSYQWRRNQTNISGATGTTYVPVTADAGDTIDVVETATRSGYTTGTATSAETAAIPAIQTITTPAIGAKGTAVEGETTTVAVSWSEATTAGSTLVAIVSYFVSGNTITPPAGGWVAASLAGAPPGYLWAVYTIDNAASQSGSKTWTVGSTDSIAVSMIEITNLPSTTQIDVVSFGDATPSANAFTIPALGPTTQPDIAILAVATSGSADASTGITGTGWTFINSNVALAVNWQAGIASGATLSAESVTLTNGGTISEVGVMQITLNASGSVAPAPPPPASGSNPSGYAPPVGNLTGWNLIFVDDFATPLAYGTWPTANHAQWTNWNSYNDVTSDTSGNGTRTVQAFTVGPNNSGDGLPVPASVIDSWQHKALSGERVAGSAEWLSGYCIPSVSGYGFGGSAAGIEYQRVMFTMQVINPQAGWKVVPLLWNNSNSELTGGNQDEMDFPEFDFARGTGAANIHFPSGDFISLWMLGNGSYTLVENTSSPNNFDIAEWHLYDLQWTATQISIYIDNTLFANLTPGQVLSQYGANHTVAIPDTAMFWVMQTETSTYGTIPVGNDHVQFDWVAIFSQA